MSRDSLGPGRDESTGPPSKPTEDVKMVPQSMGPCGCRALCGGLPGSTTEEQAPGEGIRQCKSPKAWAVLESSRMRKASVPGGPKVGKLYVSGRWMGQTAVDRGEVSLGAGHEGGGPDAISIYRDPTGHWVEAGCSGSEGKQDPG